MSKRKQGKTRELHARRQPEKKGGAAALFLARLAAPARNVTAFVRRFRWFFTAGCALITALVLFLVLRDHGVTLAVPKAELPAYQKVLDAWKRPKSAPRVRLSGYDAAGPVLLERGRPTFMVVSLAPWVSAAIADGRLASLPKGAFRWDASKFPAAFLAAEASGGTAASASGARATTESSAAPPSALPLAFDPWLVAWHRDLIGGPRAVTPRDWPAVAQKLKVWKKAGVSAFALPGREADAVLGWMAVLAQNDTGADFHGLPSAGRDALTAAFTELGGLQTDGTVQKGSFSYPWKDAVELVLQRKAAGVFLPLSRFRAINPVLSAPLIVARMPDFPGRREYGLLSDVRVLVMPARTARAKGRDVLVSYLSEPGTQRMLADALGLVPARLDSAVRDGASYAATDAARHAGVLITPPALTLSAERTAQFASAAAAALRSPREAASTVGGLFSSEK